MVYRQDLALRMSTLLTQPLDVTQALWEAQICSSGTLGRSGAISKTKMEHNVPEDHTSESLILFRSHHALADGASLTATFLDLCDEAQQIKQTIKAELKRRRKKAKSFVDRIQKWFLKCLWFCKGYIQCLLYQTKLMLTMPRNPLEVVRQLLGEEETGTRRTVSWCDAAPLQQVKELARAQGPKVTVNDVWVSCISYAMVQELKAHRERLAVGGKKLPRFPKINIVVPLHLSGGILLPNQSIGNFIGAFGAQIPGELVVGDSLDRLDTIHKTLSWIKKSPAPLIGFFTARTSAMLPLSVTAQARAVPDADQFLLWMLDDYKRLLEEKGIPLVVASE